MDTPGRCGVWSIQPYTRSTSPIKYWAREDRWVAVIEHQEATAVLGLIQAPKLRAKRHFPRSVGGASVQMDSDHRRLADLSRLDHLFGADVRSIEDEILIDPEDHACALRRFDHLLGLCHSAGHRLLDRDMLACLTGCEGHLGVQMVGDQKLYQVHLGIGEDAFQVAVDFFDTPGPCLLLGPFSFCIADGGDPGIHSPTITHLVQIGDTATTDDGDSNRVHQTFPSK